MIEFIRWMIAFAINNKDNYIWIVLIASVIFVLLFISRKKYIYQSESKKKRWLCDICFSLDCAFIYVMTLLKREMVVGVWSMWRPLHSYRIAWNTGDVEMYLQIVINILMFIPFGLLLPYCITKFNKCWKIALLSMGLSLLIELLQGVLKIGFFEIDDIINNVMGTLIGYGIYMLIKNREVIKNIIKRIIENVQVLK